MITGIIMHYSTLSQRMNRYTVYHRSSSAMAALRLLPGTMAISRKPCLALTLEKQR
jgi:hypothetical protein